MGVRCDDQGVPEVAPCVLVVDDHAAFRAAARALLEAEGFAVVGEAATGADAVAEAIRLRPDVVLLDVQLPDSDGFAVAEDLALLAPVSTVVLVSSRRARTYGDRVASSAAVGFLAKGELTGPSLRDLLGQRR